MNRFGTLAILLLAFTVTACTTKIHADYPKYLADNEDDVIFPHVAASAQYYLDQKTEDHSVKIRSFGAGITQAWAVEFGKIVDATMQGNDIRRAYDTITKVSSPDVTQGLLILFSLKGYRFAAFQTALDLKITAYKDGKLLLSKRYHALGSKNRRTRFPFADRAAMKNFIQQSTKIALDRILIRFNEDLKARL